MPQFSPTRALATVLIAASALTSAPALAFDARTVTDALIWVGASERVARGRLDGRDSRAIAEVERRLGSPENGVLDANELRALTAAAHRVREGEGYRLVTDPATGLRVGLPTAWLGPRRDAPAGSAWASPDGALSVETFVAEGGLEAFERAEQRRPGTDVTYVAGRGTWRVVSGYTADGRTFYARAGTRGAGATGFRMTYDTGLDERLARVAVAMSSDFEPAAAPRSVPRASDALAYAPREGAGDGRFEAFEPAPRYATLPESGPRPVARPADAAIGTVRDVPRTSVAAAPPAAAARAVQQAAAEPPTVELPNVVSAAPAAPAPLMRGAPLSLDDAGEALDLDPVRGTTSVAAATPDDGASESGVPASITGLVTDEGQSCPTLRGPDGTLYALVGDVPRLAPGTLVTVEATGVNSEACTAGRPVAVGGLQVRSSP